MKLDNNTLQLIKFALKEDIGRGDITTNMCVDKHTSIRATIIAKENGVVCGGKVVTKVFSLIDKHVRVQINKKDGARVTKGTPIVTIAGPAVAMLKGERIALNFLGRLSGVSTLTQQFVQKVKGTNAHILDTRKTTPGYRALEKYAVLMGGGVNHRMGLYDHVLIKDNHIAFLGKDAFAKLALRIQAARKKLPRKTTIEIEVDTLTQLTKVLPLNPDIVLLDNMNTRTIKKAVREIASWNKGKKQKILSEVSGGVNINTVRSFARLGVDRISIGALTHSARSMNFSLEM